MTGPPEAFQAAAGSSDRLVWLDGHVAEHPWSGRGSLLGVLGADDVSLTFDAGRRQVLRHRGENSQPVGDDIFDVLEAEVARDAGDPSVVWVGYLGYACRTDLPGRPADPGSGVPDAVWLRLVDPLTLPTRPSCLAEPPTMLGDRSIVGGSNEHEGRVDEGYAAAYAEVQRQLRLGNSYEVNLTYRERLASDVDPVTAYLRLREINPAPYSGYLRHRGVHLLSSSPERFAAVDGERVLEARPIKGTTRRGATPAEDAEEARRLAADPRFRAENLMVVDLLRNDLSMVCDPGTVTVPALMAVESYPSVHQLVSTIRGRLRDGLSTVRAVRALFPAGSMTGAPKRRTMEIIDAVEATPRGAYAGAFGWLSGDGRADLSVVIRTLVATRSGVSTSILGGSTGHEGRVGGWTYELGTGGGITVRSTLHEEYDETRWKAARLRAALHVDPGSDLSTP